MAKFIFYNPNREHKFVGDCVIRALCAVLLLTWDEIFLRLTMLSFEMADMPSSNEVWGRFLNLYGFIRFPAPENYTVIDFCLDHPVGKFVLCTGKHTVATVDGDYYDTSDVGNRNILFYYGKGTYV